MIGSYWLETAGDPAPRPPLDGSTDADVAVLGAGYTGLWTAYALLRRDPTLRVVICEAQVAGYGASGRNGGWCSASLPVTPAELARRTSPATARSTYTAIRAAVDDIGRVCDAEGIDACFRRGGALRVARGAHEAARPARTFAQLAALGLADGCAVLDRVALADRVRIADARGAFYEPYTAVVHPGRLVRGLAAVVDRLGGVIHEHTPVTAVETGPRPRLRTPFGDVSASTLVLAGEAWLTRLPRWKRALLPIYSLIVLTEPIDEARWAEIGWQRHECLSSHRYVIDYLSRTTDGRILFGGRGAPYHFGSRIAPAYDRHPATHAELRAQLLDWFPMLAGVGFTHHWGGPIGVVRDWLPVFRHDPANGLTGAYGYAGQGVATANLAGRTLADLILGRDTDLAALPMVDHRPRRWEPEPLRWLGARYVQWSLGRTDARAARRGRPSSGRTLAERLMRR